MLHGAIRRGLSVGDVCDVASVFDLNGSKPLWEKRHVILCRGNEADHNHQFSTIVDSHKKREHIALSEQW
jgi:hypothetical protein